MNKIIKFCLMVVASALLLSFSYNEYADTTKYKCMVQMANYSGEGAYVAISILDANQEYIKTLKVFGDDDEWFPELKGWWKSHKKNKDLTAVDAISGETLAGGERQIFTIDIPNDYLNKGYYLKFESAVEDKAYKDPDVIISLNAQKLKQKIEGEGYIRYVRLIPAK